MKLYKNLVNSIALTLQEIFTKNRYADKALEKLFKQNPQWGSRDRRFVAEGVYDVVRNFRLYSTLAESKNNFWFITAVWLVVKEIPLPEWPEFKHVNPDFIRGSAEKLKDSLPTYQSYPDWLWEYGVAELGREIWEREALALNEQAPVFLRANTLKTSREKLAESFKNDKIETSAIPGVLDGLQLSKRENVFRSKLFKEGGFEVQDAGSQLISVFLAPNPNDVVIDACAGAGGKSLHLAALMKNKGKIISLDVEAWKLEELKKRAKRAGAFNIETRLIEGKQTINSLAGKADKLLLDVPCSGMGVLKRNPDAKWKLSAEVMERTKQLQKEIISDYSNMVKINGKMMYSTCSIFPGENQLQVRNFLSTNHNFQLLEDKTLFPSEGFDGFYMALLQRTS
ncbi:MAG: RsmB/NOP family class I SAM-dependent RNA methyltransferase [bacterium]|nr:RsmB/NOP family class I SAM-dependent RNA methyltransferase [bacterium]